MIVDFTPVQKTVSTYVASSSANALDQQKKGFYMRKEFSPLALLWYTNMTAISMFCTPIWPP